MKKSIKQAVIFFLSILIIYNSSNAQWVSTEVGRDGYGIGSPAITLDESGVIHIVYLDRVNYKKKHESYIKLFYTKKVDGEFTTPVRVTNSPQGQDEGAAEIEVNTQGVNIAFYSEGFIHYILSNNFPAEPTSSIAVFSNPRPSMDIDKDGYVHLVFGSNYAHNKNGSFEIFNLGNDVGLDADIVVDNGNIAHIVYGWSPPDDPTFYSEAHYIHNQTPYSPNFVEPIRANPIESDVQYCLPCLAIDENYVHIAYRRWNFVLDDRYDCYYARLDRNNLQSPETLSDIRQVSFVTDNNIWDPRSCQIDLSPGVGGNTVHIVWDGSNDSEWWLKEIYYATIDVQQNVSQAEKITVNDYRDNYPAMAVEQNGTVHVTYSAEYKIWYANNEPTPPPGILHIASVDVGTQSSKNKVKGVATVTIVDEDNNPVAGAMVSGIWNGLTTDSDVFQTDSDGIGNAESDHVPKNSSGEFTFTVTDVSKYGWEYNPGANIDDFGSAFWNLGKRTADEWFETVPNKTELIDNYPNPFNPSTNISFQLAELSHLNLKIYNNLGQEVRTLVNRSFDVGNHSITWNGLDNFGNPVLSGIYLYKLQAGDYSEMKKMMLLK